MAGVLMTPGGGGLCIMHSLLPSSFRLLLSLLVSMLSSKQYGDVCGGLRSARDTRSAQWETSIELRGGLWLRFHPALLRCSSIHLWLQLLRAACAYITVALHSRRVGHARFIFRVFGGSALLRLSLLTMSGFRTGNLLQFRSKAGGILARIRAFLSLPASCPWLGQGTRRIPFCLPDSPPFCATRGGAFACDFLFPTAGRFPDGFAFYCQLPRSLHLCVKALLHCRYG